MTVIYGISNCDTVRKAKRWLDEHQVEYRYHDFRKQGLAQDCLNEWAEKVGWETLLNKRSSSWKALSDSDTQGLDKPAAIALMLKNPTLIKRPVLVHSGQIMVGFSIQDYQQQLRD